MKEYLFNNQVYYLKSDVDNQPKQITLDSWKGKDKPTITTIKEEDGLYWVIQEHRKDKETKEVGLNKHTIHNDNVIFIRNLIKDRTVGGRKTCYREIVLDIITQKNLPISVDEFNGGLNRSEYYFCEYYYPVKVLEFLGEIRYSGRGQILRLGGMK